MYLKTQVGCSALTAEGLNGPVAEKFDIFHGNYKVI